jgi:hypothetical protein
MDSFRQEGADGAPGVVRSASAGAARARTFHGRAGWRGRSVGVVVNSDMGGDADVGGSNVRCVCVCVVCRVTLRE